MSARLVICTQATRRRSVTACRIAFDRWRRPPPRPPAPASCRRFQSRDFRLPLGRAGDLADRRRGLHRRARLAHVHADRLGALARDRADVPGRRRARDGADRRRARRPLTTAGTMMLVSDVARFVVIVALAAVDATGHLSIGVTSRDRAASRASATGFFTPAFGGLLPLVVEEPSLGSANALIGIARQASFLIGPTVASADLRLRRARPSSSPSTPPRTWSRSASSSRRGRARPSAPPPRGRSARSGAGFRYVARFPWLWLTISLFAFVLMLQWAPIQVLTPKLVREHYDLRRRCVRRSSSRRRCRE